jgi:hypothetical protein
MRKNELFEKVLNFVSRAASYGIEIVKVDNRSKQIFFRKGTVIGTIGIESLENHLIVAIYIPIVFEVKRLDGKLLLKLLKENAEIIFGSFGLDLDNRAIIYKYNLVGDTLDFEELAITLLLMSHYADKMDEELSAMTGGKRGLDYILES